jgi:hypothetical protein
VSGHIPTLGVHGILKSITLEAIEVYPMKKLAVALISAVTLSTAIAASLPAKAFEVNIGGHHFSDKGYHSEYVYAVFFRKYNSQNWRLEGRYGSRFEAEYARRHLEKDGYYARIERWR